MATTGYYRPAYHAICCLVKRQMSQQQPPRPKSQGPKKPCPSRCITIYCHRFVEKYARRAEAVPNRPPRPARTAAPTHPPSAARSKHQVRQHRGLAHTHLRFVSQHGAFTTSSWTTVPEAAGVNSIFTSVTTSCSGSNQPCQLVADAVNGVAPCRTVDCHACSVMTRPAIAPHAHPPCSSGQVMLAHQMLARLPTQGSTLSTTGLPDGCLALCWTCWTVYWWWWLACRCHIWSSDDEPSESESVLGNVAALETNPCTCTTLQACGLKPCMGCLCASAPRHVIASFHVLLWTLLAVQTALLQDTRFMHTHGPIIANTFENTPLGASTSRLMAVTLSG